MSIGFRPRCYRQPSPPRGFPRRGEAGRDCCLLCVIQATRATPHLPYAVHKKKSRLPLIVSLPSTARLYTMPLCTKNVDKQQAFPDTTQNMALSTHLVVEYNVWPHVRRQVLPPLHVLIRLLLRLYGVAFPPVRRRRRPPQPASPRPTLLRSCRRSRHPRVRHAPVRQQGSIHSAPSGGD